MCEIKCLWLQLKLEVFVILYYLTYFNSNLSKYFDNLCAEVNIEMVFNTRLASRLTYLNKHYDIDMDMYEFRFVIETNGYLVIFDKQFDMDNKYQIVATREGAIQLCTMFSASYLSANSILTKIF